MKPKQQLGDAPMRETTETKPESDNVKFRGKRLDDLTREELLDALRQALAQIKELEGHD